MTYWALECVQKCDLWAWRRNEIKDRNFHSSNWLFAQTTHVDVGPKFCMRGRVREVVIHFKFHENRSRGPRAVEGRKSPSPIDLAHGLYNSLYYCTSHDTSNEDTSDGQWSRNEFESGGGAPVRREVPEQKFSGSKCTISRFGERFRDGQYSLVSFLFCVLLFTVPPAMQPFVKVGGTCHRALWSRRHWWWMNRLILCWSCVSNSTVINSSPCNY